jgi:hypothetical protein
MRPGRGAGASFYILGLSDPANLLPLNR